MMYLDTIRRWTLAAALLGSLAGSGLAAAGMLAGPDDAPTQAEAPRPSAPPAGKAEIAYAVTFLEAPGLSFRKLGLGFDFELDPSGGLSFLSEKEEELVTQHFRSVVKGSVVRTPGVAAPAGGVVAVVNPGNRSRPTSSVVPGPFDVPADRQTRVAGRPPGDDRAEACSVRLRGDLSADGMYVILDYAIRDRHVVEVHAEATHDGQRIEVPEVVCKDVAQRVTLPNGGAILLGLGITRTMGAGGAATIAERFVLIRTRKIAKAGAAQPDPTP